MSNYSWADKAREVIAKVKRANPGVEGEELKKLLSAAYPFGERQYHPYKVWLKEVKLAVTPPKVVFAWPKRGRPCEGQGDLL